MRRGNVASVHEVQGVSGGAKRSRRAAMPDPVEFAVADESLNDSVHEGPLLGATLPEIRAVCADFATESGFPYFWCGVRLRHAPAVPVQIGLTNFPREWIDAYRRNRWAEIDPVLRAVRERFAPFALEDLRGDRQVMRRLLEESDRFGLYQGLCVHLHNGYGEYGFFVLSGLPAPSPGGEREFITNKGMTLLARVLDNLRAIVDASVPAEQIKRLDARQAAALSYSATGYTVAETAQHMRISIRSVEGLLARAQKRLDAKTQKEAIARAVALRLIDAVIIPDDYGGEREFLL